MSPTSSGHSRTRRTEADTGGAVAPTGSGERDRVVDAVRAGCLVVVVAGHWLMAGIGTEANGGGTYDLQLANVLELRPWTQWLTWVLQVMPLFFIVGGFANAVSWSRTAERGGRWADWMATRMRRLLAPAVGLVAVWLAIVAIAQPFLERSLIHAGHRLVTKPLWFLGVYLVVTAMTPLLVRLQARLGLWAAAPWAAGAIGIDLLRFADHDTALASLNFVFVWTALTQLGMSWERLVANRRRWWMLAGGGYLALALLVGAGPYNVSMVGVGGEVSNMAPPTVALLALGVAQLGLILGVWQRLRIALADHRWWGPVTRVGASGMSLYLWHLTAMAVGVCLVALGAALGVAQPTPGSGLWWATRPLWLGVLAVILTPILRRAAPVEVRSLLAPAVTGTPVWAALLGVAAGAGAIAYLVIDGLQPVGPAVLPVLVLAGLVRWLTPETEAQLDQTML
ncbi:MAG: acyltransferase [Microthrixaceae bacterium]|nr:acyltransferase [Microthrixaceae bacterium]